MPGNGVSPFEMALAYDQLVLTITDSPESPWWFKETNVEVEGGLKNRWDIKKAGGKDGASAADKGYELTKFKVTWLLWNEELWQTYDRWLAVARPQAGKKAKPIVGIFHPIVSQAGLILFNIEEIHALKFLGVDQWEASVEFLEWREAPKTVKPQTKDPNTSTGRSDLTNGQFILQQKSGKGPVTKPSQTLTPPKR